MPKVSFRQDRCKGCGLCVSVCPKKIIAIDSAVLNDKGYHPAGVIDMDKCIGCAFCATTVSYTHLTLPTNSRV